MTFMDDKRINIEKIEGPGFDTLPTPNTTC
jgi:hypothetical protein